MPNITNMETREIQGYYGGSSIPCTILIYGDHYVIEGGQNVNATSETLEQGVNIEKVVDYDYFHWKTPINTIEELIEAVES